MFSIDRTPLVTLNKSVIKSELLVVRHMQQVRFIGFVIISMDDVKDTKNNTIYVE